MRALLALLALPIFIAPAFAQTLIPLTASAWDLDGTTAAFTTYLGQPALRLRPDSPVTINDLEFSNGTIEYDVAFTEDTRFTAMYFRYGDADNTEHVYLRNHGPNNPNLNTNIQYAAVIDGVNLWDLSGEYQSNADLNMQGYNHVKVVVRDRQLLAYVNDMETPTLYVPLLDGEVTTGSIGFDGDAYLTGVTVDTSIVAGLAAGSGFDPVHNDSRYLRDWRVATPTDLPFGSEPTDYPDSLTQWSPITAERLGMINLSRRFGATPQGDRRVVWLKTTITAATAGVYQLDFGYSDEVYVFLNDESLYFGKNLFGTPAQKMPRGRCSIDNSSISLPLVAGENELLVGVTNFFFGWGIVARLEDAAGLRY